MDAARRSRLDDAYSKPLETLVANFDAEPDTVASRIHEVLSQLKDEAVTAAEAKAMKFAQILKNVHRKLKDKADEVNKNSVDIIRDLFAAWRSDSKKVEPVEKPVQVEVPISERPVQRPLPSEFVVQSRAPHTDDQLRMAIYQELRSILTSYWSKCHAADFPNGEIYSVDDLAKSIEAAMHNRLVDSSWVMEDYRSFFLLIRSSLKDPLNTYLREALFIGSITPAQIPYQKALTLASEPLRDRIKMYQDHFFALANPDASASRTGSVTEEYRCNACGARKASYYQMQTRGADEAMTTFFTCLVCGHRWKI